MKLNIAERQKGILALVLLTMLWGIVPLIPRYLSASFFLFQQIYLRLLAGSILSAIFFRKEIDLKKLKSLPLKEWGILVFRGFIYYFLGVSLYTQALLLTKISSVHFIGAIPMTAILGFFLFKERLTLKKVILILLSFIGVATISVQDFSHLLVIGRGEMFALLSSFFISLGLVSRKWHSKKLNDKEIATLVLLFASVFLITTSLIKGEGLPICNWHTGVVLVVLVSGLLNLGIGFFQNYGFARVEAVLGSNLLSLDPVFAAILAFLVYREIPMLKEIFGGLLVISSAILMSRQKA